MITTITVNQWRIKSNAETGANEPVICVNHYEWVERIATPDGKCGRRWGPKMGETSHHHYYDHVGLMSVIYDPEFKTPCGASCWMEYESA